MSSSCALCGRPVSGKATYCSGRCRTKAYRARLAARVQVTPAPLAAPVAALPPGRPVFVSRPDGARWVADERRDPLAELLEG